MDPHVGDMQSTAVPTTHSEDSEAAAVGSRSAPGYMDNKCSFSPKPDHQRLPTRPQPVYCQVECYGRGKAHSDIVKLLNISVCENPGTPLVLFVYKVSRETVDLRNALRWFEGNRGRKREDICAVILLEKSSDTDKKQVEVAHLGMFDEKTAVMRILWDQHTILRSRVELQKGLSREMDIIKRSILGWQRGDGCYPDPPPCGESAAQT